MNSLAQFLTGEESATWESKFDDYFADAGVFGSQIRRIRPERLEKDVVKSIAHRVNQDSEGTTGDIQNFILDADNVAINGPFYPHFKLLFKATQMSLSIKRRDAYSVKQSVNDGKIAEIATDIET